MSSSTGADAPAPPPDALPARAQSGGPASAPAAGERRFPVLIVENDPLFRDFLQNALQARFPSLALSTASGVQEALLRIRAARPGLIIVDVHLPDGHGFELTRRIRQMSVDTRVVFLSGYDLPEYRVEAYRSGADHYLSKETTTIDEIVAFVESVIASRGAP
jgi:two-component system OmpR family response regulator